MVHPVSKASVTGKEVIEVVKSWKPLIRAQRSASPWFSPESSPHSSPGIIDTPDIPVPGWSPTQAMQAIVT